MKSHSSVRIPCLFRLIPAITLLAMGHDSRAASVVWVSDNGDEGSAGTTGTGSDGVVRGAWYPPVSAGTPYVDQGFIDLLISAGHTVTRFNPTSTKLSVDDVPLLNAYDVIILGTALNSGPFNLNSQGAKWNTDLTKPMIVTKSTLTRANRMGYLLADKEFDSGADSSTTASGKLTLLNPAHPVFAGISHTNTGGSEVMTNYSGIRIASPPNNRGTSVQCASLLVGGVDQAVSNAMEPGGVWLAALSFNPMNPGVNIPAGQAPAIDPAYQATGYAIAEWPAGTIVRSTQVAGEALAGYRMLFSCGTRDASGTVTSAPNPLVGALDLSADGQQLFLNAVNHAVQQYSNWNNASANFQWDDTSANWSFGTWVSGGDAYFGATGAGTVTLASPVTAHSASINNADYSFAASGGSTLTLAGATPSITVNSNAVFGATLAGSDGLTLKGTGTLTLETPNSYSGGTFVRGGRVILKATGVGPDGAHTLDGIQALDAGATVQNYAGTPVEPLTNGSLVRAANGQMGRFTSLVMSGGTLDLNGEDNSTQWPAPEGTGVITNSSPYARAAFRIGQADGVTRTFSGIIQNGNGGVVTVSTVPNTAPGVTPVVYKQGYRTDLDLQSMAGDSARFVLDADNTFTGFTRIGGGVLSFTARGKWGKVVTTGDTVTSTPNGSVICNGGINQLRVDFNGTSQITGGLSGNGGVYANNAEGTCSVLTVGAGNISNTVWPTGGGGQNGRITDNTTGSGGIVALTKTGTGTIGFPTAQNNYSGPTMINNGVLEFTATGAPSPNSDHQINSPGKLKLSYSGGKNINSLFLDGTKLPAGTYSETTHPDFITGPGSLTVVELHPPVVSSITAARTGNAITVTWTACGMLQESTDLATWTDLPGASSPYAAPITAARKYFRVK